MPDSERHFSRLFVTGTQPVEQQCREVPGIRRRLPEKYRQICSTGHVRATFVSHRLGAMACAIAARPVRRSDGLDRGHMRRQRVPTRLIS
eukprot:230955-Chlamydomonas_euryale.AAC.9